MRTQEQIRKTNRKAAKRYYLRNKEAVSQRRKEKYHRDHPEARYYPLPEPEEGGA